MKIGNQEIHEIKIFNAENGLIASITDKGSMFSADSYTVTFIPAPVPTVKKYIDTINAMSGTYAGQHSGLKAAHKLRASAITLRTMLLYEYETGSMSFEEKEHIWKLLDDMMRCADEQIAKAYEHDRMLARTTNAKDTISDPAEENPDNPEEEVSRVSG